MPHNNRNNRYLQLADKWLNGSITPEEKAEFMDWYNSREEELPVEIPFAFAKDEGEHRDRILTKIMARQQPVAVVKKMAPIRRWWAAAAVVLLLATGAYFLVKPDAPPQSQLAVKMNTGDIEPGRKGAILTLADGSSIVLDSLGGGTIANQNGTRVLFNNGELRYDAANAKKPTYNTMSTPKGRQFHLTLPDGTGVWLNAASSISFPTAFSGNERVVSIMGEVYFEVAKNKAMPFRVKINNETGVEVLGTHFNINSYQDDGTIRTTLLEGSIRFHEGTQQKLLIPGQQAIVMSGNNRGAGKDAEIRVQDDADLEQVIAWKDGVFSFKNASLQAVMHQIERWYDVEVVYDGTVSAREFHGKIGRDLKLSQVINILEGMDVNFRIEGKKLIVRP